MTDATAQDERSASAPLVKRTRPAALQHIGPRYAIIAVWGAMIVVYWLTRPGLFMTVPTFQTIFSGQQPLVFMTAALLCTIIVGEFVDLSVPGVFGFSATILPVLVVNHGWPAWAAVIIAIGGALLVGVVQAFLVVKVNVNTIVVTLGMGTFLEGISLGPRQATRQPRTVRGRRIARTISCYLN